MVSETPKDETRQYTNSISTELKCGMAGFGFTPRASCILTASGSTYHFSKRMLSGITMIDSCAIFKPSHLLALELERSVFTVVDWL